MRPRTTPALTPEVAERVVTRFLERQAETQRAESREKERQAEVARVQELADLLGTTPDDIVRLAREVQHDAPKGVAVPEEHAIRKPRPTWPLHAGYLGAVALCLCWGAALSTRRPTFWSGPGVNPPVALPNGRPDDVALRFDPYVGGYTRDPFWAFRFGQGETIAMDPSLKSPPRGLKVSLATPLGRTVVVGSLGKIPDTLEAAEELRASIRSLVAFEESRAKVQGSLPTAGYSSAPYYEGMGNWSGQPTYLGWHQIEVTNGRRVFRGLLPDHRYAKGEVQFQRTMKLRLARFLDTKFFPSQPPANLRPGATKMTPPVPLPKGIALMVWNSQRTVWFQGKGEAKPMTNASLAKVLDAAALNLGDTPETAGYLQAVAIVPGGETNGYWPMPAIQDDNPAKTARERTDQTERLLDAINAGLSAETAAVP